MPLKYRRIVYIIFILAFFIATPIILTYSMGYRYNFKKNKFEKTGILFINLNQKDANIYLNGELYKNKVKKFSLIPKFMAGKIEKNNEIMISLLPGEYDLKISKYGYWTWEKKFNVYPNITTFTPKIFLFKEVYPELMLEGEINHISLLDNNKFLYAIGESNTASGTMKTLLAFSPKLRTVNTIYSSMGDSLSEPKYSATGKKILERENGKYIIFDTVEHSNVIYLEKNTFDVGLKKFKWDDNDDSILYALGSENMLLYKIDLPGLKVIPINILKCDDYLVHKDSIYIIENSDKERKTNLKMIQGRKEKIISSLPYSDGFVFGGVAKDYLLLRNIKSKELYLINPLEFSQDKRVKSIIPKVEKFAWNKAQDKLLYINGFELFIYDLNENKNYLITRLSNNINNAEWFVDENYIIFNTDSNINIIESSIGDKNYIELISKIKINDFLIDSEGENLYFSGQIGKSKGLFHFALF